MNNLFNRIIAILIQYKWILIIFFVLVFIYQMTKIDIEIELNTDVNNLFSIYWAERGLGFHETRRIKFPIFKDKYRYRVSLNLFFKNINKFRIDPLINEGQITIKKIVIKGKYFRPVVIDKTGDFEKFVPLNDVKNVTCENNQMTIVSEGTDPYLALSIDPSFDVKSFIKIILFITLVCIGTMVSDKSDINKLYNIIIAFFSKYKWILIILFVLICIYQMTRTSIEIELNTDSNNDFSIYWAEKGSFINESRKIKFHIFKDKFRYKIAFNSFFKNIYELRIDPLISEGKITINKIVIKEKYFRPVVFDKTSDFEKFIPFNDVESVSYDSNQMTIISEGIDPYLVVSLSPSFGLKHFIKITFFNALAYIGIIIFLVIVNNTLFRESCYRYTIIVMLLLVLSLTLIMAIVSINYSHPDEKVHFKAAEYYFDYLTPPAIGDRRVEGTYSAYGVSRLYTLTPLYLIAGKLSNMINVFIENRIISVRLFNVFLFAIMVMLILCRREIYWVSLFIFLCPQMWYIFSYINDDAFPLFISFLIFYQIAYSKSVFNKFLSEKGILRLLCGGIWVGLLLGIILISKTNYYSVFAFVLSYFVLNLIFSNDKMRLFKRYCFVVFVAVLIFSGRMYHNQMINDFGIPSKNKILETYKKEQFKNNTAPEEMYYAYHLKEKGVKISELITNPRWNWHNKTFVSFVGMYGHVSISSDPDLYKIYLLVYASFIFVILFFTFRYYGIEERLLSLLVLSLSILLMLASLHHSWIVDFQAQGRYLFPIVIMFCFLFFRINGKINTRVLNYYTIIFFCLSYYSFVFTALRRIPKG